MDLRNSTLLDDFFNDLDRASLDLPGSAGRPVIRPKEQLARPHIWKDAEVQRLLQEAYDEAYDRLWTALDWLEERLSTRRYLMGDAITEADVRLFTTLVRFDAVYHGHFKCNRQRLTEMEHLWGYARDLFQTPGFGSTVDFDQIKAHYYVVHSDINPTGVIPRGPDLAGWNSPHGRG